MSNPKSVIFDLGRVLVHWDSAVVLQSVSAISHVDATTLRALLTPLVEPLGTGRIDGVAFHRYLVEHAGVSPVWQDFYDAYCRGLCRNDEALAYAVQLQRSGVDVGVISNTNLVHTTWLRDHVPELRELRTVVLSCEVGLIKPDPAIYHLALARLGRPPSQALFVDDLVENVAAAQTLGMAGVVHTTWDDTRAAIAAWLDGTV